MLTFMFMPFKVLPKFEEYRRRNNISKADMRGGYLEVYNYATG